MNRKIWDIDHFSEAGLTIWICPTCFTGALRLNRFPMLTENDLYSATFICTNSNCLQEFVGNGKVSYYSDIFQHYVSKQSYGKKLKHFRPVHFSPNLRMFQLYSSDPPLIILELDKSFSTFWSDKQSSANAVRRALERMMDSLSIVGVDLHQRIMNCKSISSDVRDMLMAIKWIGNTGSHGDDITRHDLLDAYFIIEHCLNELFPDRKCETPFQIANEINQIRSPRSSIAPKLVAQDNKI
jgi:uncharacterized protein DUF4145